MTADQAANSPVLAANQGLYNGFLAVGQLWGALAEKRDVTAFFLLYVITAGVYGAITASTTILFVQATPALIAFVLTLIAPKRA